MHSMEFLCNLSSALLLTLLLLISGGRNVESKNHAVSVDMIHRDSPGSPLYDPSYTPYERLMESIARSYKRQASLTKTYLQSTSTSNSVASPITPDTTIGEFVMPVYYGTPPQKTMAIIDTGSDLIWTLCEPCLTCNRQTDAIFNPVKSTSDIIVPGNSYACTGNGFENTGDCSYFYAYGDYSYTTGYLLNETLTLISAVGISTAAFPKILVGCGDLNDPSFTTGLIGLGGGPISFTSQSHQIVFSYCLTPYGSGKNSTITFGPNPLLTGPNVMTTPLQTLDPPTFYYIYLEAASVGSQRFNTPAGEGPMVLDSGTTLTLLLDVLYNEIEPAIKAQIHATPVPAPQGLTLCYNTTVPPAVNVTMHFTRASLVVTPENLFILVADNTYCLSIVSAGTNSGSLAIFGNVNQGNFDTEYSLENRTVSFLQKDCP